MNKLTSLIKKAKTIIIDGLEPYEEGRYFFENPNEIIEDLAKERLPICLGCNYFIEEPNSLFKVGGKYGAKTEDIISELTNKSCNKCGCILSYKVRQIIQPCEKWQEKK